MTLASFIISLVGPVVARILASLGLSLITLTGLVAATSQLRNLFISHAGSLPVDVVMLAGLCGVWEASGMVLGAITFCVTWQSTAGFWRLAKT